jgi:hypothetical protein
VFQFSFHFNGTRLLSNQLQKNQFAGDFADLQLQLGEGRSGILETKSFAPFLFQMIHIIVQIVFEAGKIRVRIIGGFTVKLAIVYTEEIR